MRHTRAHTANRRSHHAIKTSVSAVCEKCSSPKINHRMCMNCGTYKGKAVLNVEKALEKKVKKSQEKK